MVEYLYKGTLVYGIRDSRNAPLNDHSCWIYGTETNAGLLFKLVHSTCFHELHTFDCRMMNIHSSVNERYNAWHVSVSSFPRHLDNALQRH